MSDFYQILKREIEPINPPLASSKKEDDFLTEKKPVDNLADKLEKDEEKKIKKITRPKKNNSAKKENKILPAKKSRAKKEKLSIVKSAMTDKSDSEFLTIEPANPIWLTMAEAAKLGGIQKRTIKRAIRAKAIKFRIIESRYQVDLRSTLLYFFSKKKLWNKLQESGIGQYVEEWKK
jgi:uncharacterized protein with von Willebrand factor type A (vWA) domain